MIPGRGRIEEDVFVDLMNLARSAFFAFDLSIMSWMKGLVLLSTISFIFVYALGKF